MKIIIPSNDASVKDLLFSGKSLKECFTFKVVIHIFCITRWSVGNVQIGNSLPSLNEYKMKWC